GLGETRLRVTGVGDDVTIGQQNRLDLGGQPFDSGVVEHFQGDVGGVDGGVGVAGGVVLVPCAGQVRAGGDFFEQLRGVGLFGGDAVLVIGMLPIGRRDELHAVQIDFAHGDGDAGHDVDGHVLVGGDRVGDGTEEVGDGHRSGHHVAVEHFA